MADNKKKLTILHSNDLHGDFLAEMVDDRLIGGVSRLSGYVNQIRGEEPNTLYCIAGDMFRGSVIDSEFRGVSTIEIMNMLAPDVVTIGNHETDYGIAHLLFLEKCAKFPIINANLHIKTNNARMFKPYHIVEMDGMKILFIGVLTEEIINQTRNEGLIGSFVDIREASQEVGRICNTYRSVDIDLTVLLTHIGYEEDKALAELLDPAWGVDIIIGGHSHTLLEEPTIVNGILIVQVGTGTDQIGRFDLLIDTDTNCVSDCRWQSIPINATNCPRDAALEDIISYYKNQTDAKYQRMITHFKRQLTHPSRYQETELGNLFADILRDSLRLDIALLGSGSIRTTELGPIVLLSDLAKCFPYNDPIYLCHITGAQFRRMILYMLRDEALEGKHTEFYQLSDGLELVYEQKTHSFSKFDFCQMPIEDNHIYTVGIQSYHYKNFEAMFSVPIEEILKNGKPRVVATNSQEILEEYLSEHQNLERSVSGRLIIHGENI